MNYQLELLHYHLVAARVDFLAAMEMPEELFFRLLILFAISTAFFGAVAVALLVTSWRRRRSKRAVTRYGEFMEDLMNSLGWDSISPLTNVSGWLK